MEVTIVVERLIQVLSIGLKNSGFPVERKIPEEAEAGLAGEIRAFLTGAREKSTIFVLGDGANIVGRQGQEVNVTAEQRGTVYEGVAPLFILNKDGQEIGRVRVHRDDCKGSDVRPIVEFAVVRKLTGGLLPIAVEEHLSDQFLEEFYPRLIVWAEVQRGVEVGSILLLEAGVEPEAESHAIRVVDLDHGNLRAWHLSPKIGAMLQLDGKSVCFAIFNEGEGTYGLEELIVGRF